jgi:quercetin dioxygenase-like cupin family protein
MNYHFGKQEDVPKQEVKITGSRGAYIQWLVTKDTGSPRYALRRFLIEPSGVIAYHKHKYEETVYVLKGFAEVRVENERRKISSGEFVFIDQNVPHSIKNVGNSELEFLCVIPYVEDMSITPLGG